MTLHKRALDDGGGDGVALLERALRRFAAAGRSRPRRRFSPSPCHEAVLRALLAEMDETVLPRQFELISDTGAKLVLTVSNRRLLSVAGAGEGIRAATDPEDLADQAMVMLRALLDQADSVTLDVIKAAPPDTAASSISCSVRLLADAAGLAAFDDTDDALPGNFVEMVKALAHAWLRFDTGWRDREGDGPDDLIEQLKSVGRQVRDGGVPLLQESQFRLHEPNCLLLPMDDGRTLVIAVADGTRLMALLSAKDRQAVFENWQRTKVRDRATDRALPPEQ